MKKKKNIVQSSNWSEEELKFFKIKIDRIESFQEFFGIGPPTIIEDYESIFKAGRNSLSLKKINKVIEDIRELLNLDLSAVDAFETIDTTTIDSRSEERRVGKECATLCRSRWSPYH